MKKVLFSLFFLVIGTLTVWADGCVATLQHGETMTMYTSNSALQDAYKNAVDGDIITLSPGTFAAQTTIAKQVRIIGTYGMNDTSTDATILTNSITTITVDNVYIEGICFSATLTIGSGISNLTLKRCYLVQTNANGDHTNTLIDQCILMRDYNAVSYGKNFSIKNSTIRYFSSSNDVSHIVNITNCYVAQFGGSTGSQPYGIYKNNVLRLYSTNAASYTYTINLAYSEYHYNYFYKTKGSNYSIDYTINYATSSMNDHNTIGSIVFDNEFSYPCSDNFNKTGQDGTNLGITGGTGFNQWPGIPRVVTATIDAQTDDKGKLNASFTVSPEK